ncbi:hypothetical protein FB45DRAFT_1034159 [Roridomyces roridus]|uniref:Uncharacterized protein n=1 Tax=Roridomyces roridus TaxID=1738132 RepID=A0AAD7BDN5_9AGAR|nr:hypothetical protein FB45DRAFT_1034159 [Roridomyces roridus]
MDFYPRTGELTSWAHIMFPGSTPPLITQLRQDGYLTETQVALARSLLKEYNPFFEANRNVQHIHEIGQPFIVDFSQNTSICVTGPHSFIPVQLYPRIAKSGVLTVCFVRASEDDNDESLFLPVVHQHTPIEYLPQFSRLCLIAGGGPRSFYLPHVDLSQRYRVWQWKRDDKRPAQSEALHYLFHPPYHSPAMPSDSGSPKRKLPVAKDLPSVGFKL